VRADCHAVAFISVQDERAIRSREHFVFHVAARLAAVVGHHTGALDRVSGQAVDDPAEHALSPERDKVEIDVLAQLSTGEAHGHALGVAVAGGSLDAVVAGFQTGELVGSVGIGDIRLERPGPDRGVVGIVELDRSLEDGVVAGLGEDVARDALVLLPGERDVLAGGLRALDHDDRALVVGVAVLARGHRVGAGREAREHVRAVGGGARPAGRRPAAGDLHPRRLDARSARCVEDLAAHARRLVFARPVV